METVEGLGHGVLGRRLRLRVDGRGDLQSLGVQGLLVDVEQVEQLLGDLPLDQPVGPGGLVRCAGLFGWDRRREDLCRTVGRREGAHRHHAVEHPVPPLGRALGVDRGIQRRRPLDQRGE
jgi:hypothetical protein